MGYLNPYVVHCMNYGPHGMCPSEFCTNPSDWVFLSRVFRVHLEIAGIILPIMGTLHENVCLNHVCLILKTPNLSHISPNVDSIMGISTFLGSSKHLCLDLPCEGLDWKRIP